MEQVLEISAKSTMIEESNRRMGMIGRLMMGTNGKDDAIISHVLFDACFL